MQLVVCTHSLFVGCGSGGHTQGEPGHHQAMDHTACDGSARY